MPPVDASLFQPFLQKLPDDLRQEVQSWLEPGSERFASLLEDAQALLNARLTASEDAYAD